MLLLRVDPLRPERQAVRKAARLLRRGGLVAFPTETVYGLGADATNPAAVERIFAAKGRPADNPLIVHVAGVEEVVPLVEAIPPRAWRLTGYFWPGPLTLIFRRGSLIPPVVSAGLDTVAVRMPGHPVALALIREAGVPVAAPSANLSGRPSPTTAEHVLDDLEDKIDALIDAGPADIGVESTVLDVTVWPPVILRPGGISREELEEVIGEVRLDPRALGEGLPGPGDEAVLPRSPGMKYTHYAPAARLILVEGPPEKVVVTIQELADREKREGRRVGVLATRETAGRYRADVVQAPGSRGDAAGMAAGLYAALRFFDYRGVQVVLAEGVQPEGLGLAVMNRLRRAASQVIHV